MTAVDDILAELFFVDQLRTPRAPMRRDRRDRRANARLRCIASAGSIEGDTTESGPDDE
jgi:hypothetical protein